MAILYQGIHLFVEPLGLVIAVVFIYGVVGRLAGPAWLQHAISGVFFGVAAVYSMFNPLPLAEGVIIDMRNLFVGVSAAFFGPLAGIVTLAISAITRISIGGAGMVSGLAAMCLATAGGLAWRHFVQPSKLSVYKRPLVLGLFVSAHIGAVFLLPSEIIKPFLYNIAPILVAANILGTYVLYGLIAREKGLIEEIENLSEAAAKDPLTNLLNRRSTAMAVAELPQDRVPGNGRAILYYDIDNFKAVNDTHGHAVGDAIRRWHTKVPPIRSRLALACVGRQIRPTLPHSWRKQIQRFMPQRSRAGIRSLSRQPLMRLKKDRIPPPKGQEP